ncbi:MAG: flagellar type III secretion system pore protein FliP [Treponema sp.]|uniref:flagellar type III secretion system pore protein FliP n=1 Tax=Treponema sp. TaxID=166 RepID=UPI0025DA04C7|nr:flagellar type III secretion system pore protein FliP [Treponema sp.]MBQ9281536.1 flagellar type III secretion system pore protein FliP [Treponema sp.]
MKNFISISFHKWLPRIVCAAFVSIFCLFPVASQSRQNQNFPQGSVNGRTEMSGQVRGLDFPNIDVNITRPQGGEQVAFSVQLLLLLTVLTLAPSLLILTTCFLRFSIVLDFIKRALSLQQVPPTSVLNGIALFMTIFIMFPTLQAVYNNSLKPLSDGELTIEQAYRAAEAPLRNFMLNQTITVQSDGSLGSKYISSFLGMANLPAPNGPEDIPTYVIVPAYILHELTVAFKIGVFLYIPFIVIDMVVASILMSMGMMMLPPVQISMHFKLMLFVMIDGWGLLTQQLFVSVIQ